MSKIAATACILGALLFAGTASAGTPIKGVGHKQDAAKCAAATKGHQACPKPAPAPSPAAKPAPAPAG